MKVSVMSDSHDRIEHLEWAIAESSLRGAKVLFHCGDLVSPFMVLTLAKFPGEVHLILGNNRGDPHLLAGLIQQYPFIKLHGDYAYLEISGKKIAMVHYPQLGRPLAKSQEFDYVFCGHTHKFEVARFGRTLFINPGEIMGKEGRVSFVLLDLETATWERIDKPYSTT